MHFDGTISLGNIVTIISFLVIAGMHWKTVTLTLKQHGEYIAEHKRCHQTQMQIVTELRTAIAFMKGRMSAGASAIPERMD
jgi:hypothetical protein